MEIDRLLSSADTAWGCSTPVWRAALGIGFAESDDPGVRPDDRGSLSAAIATEGEIRFDE